MAVPVEMAVEMAGIEPATATLQGSDKVDHAV
jgi:hypothetical protein